MLRDKVTDKISELQNNFTGSDRLKSSIIFQTLNPFNFVLSLLTWMTIQPAKTVNSSLSALYEDGIKIGKDVFYRLKNSTNIVPCDECRDIA